MEASRQRNQKHRSMEHRDEVADRAEQRKELDEDRGIGDRSKAERMQKRSRDNEALEAALQPGAKRQRLMQEAMRKRASGATNVPEVADVDRGASKKDSFYPPVTIADPKNELRKSRTRRVSSQLQHFISNLGSQADARWFLAAEEFGGGGDCLFHAIRGGLNELREKYNDKYEEIHQNHKHMIETSQGLRGLAAKGISDDEDEVFMNLVMNFKVDESTHEWKDSWSPTEELIQSNFHVLADVAVTRVNGLEFPNERISFQLNTNEEIVHPMPHLEVNLANLREGVKNRLSTPGHVHWGTNLDIAYLSKALDIGFIVFPNANASTLDNRGWIYAISDTRADFSHWMMLYCTNNQHFQLAVLERDQTSSQSVFLLDEVPAGIRHHYNINNQDMHMGRARGVGFS